MTNFGGIEKSSPLASVGLARGDFCSPQNNLKSPLYLILKRESSLEGIKKLFSPRERVILRIIGHVPTIGETDALPKRKEPLMSWFDAAKDELETFFDIERQIPEEENKQRGMDAINAFHDQFIHLASKLRIRDQWLPAHAHIAPFSTGIIEHSAKMRIDFTIGVSLYGWFIESPIAFARQIGHMRDEYWKQIIRVSELGKAELCDYGRPVGWPGSVAAKKLTQHKLSLAFSIARDFTLLALSTDEGIPSLGYIHITIPVESDESAVTNFFEQGLDALYRSNYLLFRSASLERNRLFKKAGLREPFPPLQA
jgi:hypothetical protein